MEKDLIQQAIDGVKARLGYKAQNIIWCEFPCMLVCCESWLVSGVQDPRTADCIEYARIDRETGEIFWTDWADILTGEQRQQVEKQSQKIKFEIGGFIPYMGDEVVVHDDDRNNV